MPAQLIMELQAAANGHAEVVRFLVRMGADVNTHPSRYWGLTALQHAALEERLEVVEELLRAGTNVNAPGAILAPSWLCMPLRKVVIWMLLRNFLQQVLKLMQFQGTESRQYYKLL
jgi:ankyrin repeat protein